MNKTTRCIALLLALLTVAGPGRAQTLSAPRAPLQSLLELNESLPATVLPTIKAWTLRQNTKVLFVENHTLPMIDVMVTFAAGSHQDGDSPGLAAMMLSLFNEGSAVKDANALADAFDSLGVMLGQSITREQSRYSLRSLSAPDVREPALQLFTEMLGQPGFTEAAQRRVKHELITQLKEQEDDPYMRALYLISKELYPGQSLARPLYGSVQGIERIDEAQLRAFHRRAYTAANAHIMIVGDLSPEQAQVLSRKLADGLPAGPALAAPPPIIASVRPAQTHQLENDATNSLLMLAQNAPPNHHVDTVAVRAGHDIFNHILHEQLREKHGVTYGVSSLIPPAQSASYWLISFNTPPHYSQSALGHTQALFTQFLRDGPTEKQLDVIKRHALRSLPQLTASNLAIRDELALISRFNQPLSFHYETEQIQRLTRAQIKAAMNRHFSANGWVSVNVGPSVEQMPLPEITEAGTVTEHSCKSTN